MSTAASLRSEFKKLLTVRSTYFTTAFVLALTLFISIFVYGYKEARPAADPLFVADLLYQVLGLVAMAGVILSILLVAHEYRYNTITYTFTLSRRRLSVLLSKVIVMFSYTAVVAAAMLIIAYLGGKFGISLHHAVLAPQHFNVGEAIAQYFAYTWGYVLSGIILAVIIRGLVGSFVAYFLIPTAESILSLIIKGNTKYLPFRALDATAAIPNQQNIDMGLTTLSHMTAFIVTCAYLGFFGLIAVILFVKRDAN